MTDELKTLGDEMAVIERNGLEINGEAHTFTFIPSGDQKWLVIIKGMAGTGCT